MTTEQRWGTASRRTIGEVIAAAVTRDPNKPAILFGDDVITYRDLDERANQYANAFADLGIGRGDCVAVMMNNCPEMVYAWIGLAKLGAIEVGINTAYSGDWLQLPLATTGTKVVLADNEYVDRILDVMPKLEKLERLVVRGGIPNDGAAPVPLMTLHSMVDGASTTPPVVAVEPCYSDPVSIQFTGGTTGRSKGVIQSHNMQLTTAQAAVDAVHQTSEDVVYSPLPMFHFSIKAVALLSSFIVGGTAAISVKFSVSRTWSDVRRYNATGVNVLGSMMLMLWNLPESEDDRNLPVRYITGVPIPEHLHFKIEERYGCRLVEIYGQSETGTLTINSVDTPATPGASGKVLPHYDVRIFDEDERELEVGEVGEICARPLQPYVMQQGYFGDPEGTAAVQSNLWHHTGDRGRFDGDGNLYFVDRLKDSIRRRGENISSMEIEQSVLLHPAVKEVVAHAVASEFTEDEVKLCVIVDPTSTLTYIELMDFCVEKLPHFAVPRYIEFMEDLPRTPVGRPQKNVLRERGLTEATWDRESVGYELKR